MRKVLSLSDFSLDLMLDFLGKFGFLINKDNKKLSFRTIVSTKSQHQTFLQKLNEVIEEENFKKRYFSQISLEILEQVLTDGNL